MLAIQSDAGGAPLQQPPAADEAQGEVLQEDQAQGGALPAKRLGKGCGRRFRDGGEPPKPSVSSRLSAPLHLGPLGDTQVDVAAAFDMDASLLSGAAGLGLSGKRLAPDAGLDKTDMSGLDQFPQQKKRPGISAVSTAASSSASTRANTPTPSSRTGTSTPLQHGASPGTPQHVVEMWEQEKNNMLKKFYSMPADEPFNLEKALQNMFLNGNVKKLQEARNEKARKEEEDDDDKDKKMWDDAKTKGFFFPARGGALAGRFDRALKNDKQLAKGYKACQTREIAAKYRAEWCEKSYNHYYEHKELFLQKNTDQYMQSSPRGLRGRVDMFTISCSSFVRILCGLMSKVACC